MSGTEHQVVDESGTQQEVAQAAAGSAGKEQKETAENPFKSLDEAMEEIKKLRKENGGHRTKNKTLEEQLGSMSGTLGKLKTALGIEEEEVDPETKIKNLQAHAESLELELTMKDLAHGFNIPKENEAYFRYLMSEKLNLLEEGEEVSEEDIEEIAKKVIQVSGNKSTSTGVDGGKKNPDAPSGLDAASFSNMTVSEKSQLYSKDPNLYNRLLAEAKTKKLLK